MIPALMAWFACMVVLVVSSPPNIAYAKSASSTLPNIDAVHRHAFDIFNSVHSALRLWGSSLNHNGMSFFLATVPEGQLLYHGDPKRDRPTGIVGKGYDWLAFELEHAQLFSASWDGKKRTRGEVTSHNTEHGTFWNNWYTKSRLQSQMPLSGNNVDDDQGANDDNNTKEPWWPEGPTRGYFHTFRTTRPLHLLYIDGMGAGKVDYGCLDTQDYVLLDWPVDEDNLNNPLMGELDRAEGLCQLAKDWAWKGGQIDGFIRAEAGFEIIYCDLGEGGGLDEVSVHASPFANETSLPFFTQFEYMRGVTMRYHGFPAGRVQVDWSSMVSAFFYDVNLTNPDPERPELPRLVGTERSERRNIRKRTEEVVAARHSFRRPAVDWQGIVDMVVTRFATRLKFLVSDTTPQFLDHVGQLIGTVVNPHIDFPTVEQRQVLVDRCAKAYLTPAFVQSATWTPEDEALSVAIEHVTQTICSTLFDIRDLLPNSTLADPRPESKRIGSAEPTGTARDPELQIRKIVANLMGELQWTTWKQCDPCADPYEICLVAMFPWGDPEDHYHPRCQGPEDVDRRSSYWWKNRR